MKVSPEVATTASFAADLADVLFKLLAALLIVPSLVLWVYLNRLGWNSLFLEAVLSLNGLWGLLLWTSMVLMSLLVTVCGPSWIVAMLGRSAASPTAAFPRWFVRGVLFSVAWLWFWLFVGVELWPHSLWLTLLIAVTGDFVCMLLCFDRTARWSKKYPKCPAALVFLFAGGLWFASVLALLPYVYLRLFFGSVDSMGQSIAWILCAFVVGLAGYFPGLLAYRGQQKKWSRFELLTKTALGLLIVAFALIMLPAALAPKFPWVFLEKLDVYSAEPKEFMVIEDKVLPGLQAISATGKGDSAMVKVFSRFSFGDVRLLCKDPYLPYDPKQITFGATNEDAALEKGRQAGNHCVAVKRDDVRELR